MQTDLDSLLLDKLFQPMTDRVSAWISCFGLARFSLGSAVLFQLAVVAIDLERFGDPLQRTLTAAVTLLALFGAQQAWTLIARTERAARPGGMNLRRITLRWQRVAWMVVTTWSIATGLASDDATGLWLGFGSVAWLGVIYFVSCTPCPPPARAAWRAAFA